MKIFLNTFRFSRNEPFRKEKIFLLINIITIALFSRWPKRCKINFKRACKQKGEKKGSGFPGKTNLVALRLIKKTIEKNLQTEFENKTTRAGYDRIFYWASLD